MPSALTVAERQRVDRQLRLATLARGLLPGVNVPYYGHMRLSTAGHELDVLLGPVTRTGPEVSIIDWQRAPLSEVFFAYDEGEDYEIDVDQRFVSGRLLERNSIGFDAGELVRIASRNATYARQGEEWKSLPNLPIGRLNPRPPEARSRATSPIDITLDASQQRVVALPPLRSVLVLGEAGFGKTTVALHRLAALRKSARSNFRAAVIVPTEGLRRLSALLLDRLGAPDVEVWLYDQWAAKQARRAFRGLPRRESQDASAGVIRIKRHPAIRSALSEFATQSRRASDEDDWAPKTEAGTRYTDLEYFFGDRAYLERVAAESAGTVRAGDVAEAVEHTRVQFSETTEQEYAHVDAERLKTLDGRAIDEGTPMGDAKTIDTEDYAVLFELDRLRAHHRGRPAVSPNAYDCIVVDESQEFAPLELALIGRSRAPHGTLIVAGDAGQQVDPTACFTGWPATMAELGLRDYESATLEVSYRCPPEVTALARSILWPESAPPAERQDAASLAFTRFDNECHFVAWLIDELRSLGATDSRASVALICRTPEGARRMAVLVRRGIGVRLALDGDFPMHGGVSVTCVQEAKGLEFDHVVVPDASPRFYPDLPESRRALYVAVTRPMHQLVLATSGGWTPILGGGFTASMGAPPVPTRSA
jgi:DNA helicase II / ATP-dependent DNA helicase PcrA